jgi:four helix bundle protein
MHSYRELEVWQLARELSVGIHRMTMAELPKFEMYEEGSQIRRASKSVRHNIVEGYGRRRYRAEFIHHLAYAHASCDETADILDTLWETGSLKDENLHAKLAALVATLGRKLNRFIEAVEQGHQSPK